MSPSDRSIIGTLRFGRKGSLSLGDWWGEFGLLEWEGGHFWVVVGNEKAMEMELAMGWGWWF